MTVKKIILLANLALIMSIVYAQVAEPYDFKPVQELKRHVGLQDPFMKPDGSCARVIGQRQAG